MNGPAPFRCPDPTQGQVSSGSPLSVERADEPAAAEPGGLVAELAQVRAEKARLEAQLAESRVDPLTGLLTRRGWSEMAEAAISGTTEDWHILLLDLTDFKRVNDRHGHAAGDALLQVQSERLRAWCARRGFPARFGGDEFVAAVHLRSDEMASELNHVAALMAEPMPWGRRAIYSPAAIGVATAGAHPLRVLLAAADRAMYRSKPRWRRLPRILLVRRRELARRVDAGSSPWWNMSLPCEYVEPDLAPVHRPRHGGGAANQKAGSMTALALASGAARAALTSVVACARRDAERGDGIRREGTRQRGPQRVPEFGQRRTPSSAARVANAPSLPTASDRGHKLRIRDHG